MRRFAPLAFLLLVTSLPMLAGCDSGGAKEGVPDKVDFSGKTDYSPAAKPVGPMTPGDAKKAEAASKKAAKEAPADTEKTP
jgi:hypothetical protein